MHQNTEGSIIGNAHDLSKYTRVARTRENENVDDSDSRRGYNNKMELSDRVEILL